MSERDVKVLRAKDVYLLMKKEYRISRNIRASWFFQHLTTPISFTPKAEIPRSDEELQIISVIPEDGSELELGQNYQVVLTPSTIMTFLSCQYRLVITLDLSPSVACVDVSTGEVLYEKVYKTLERFLLGLVQPFHLPENPAKLSPHVIITVLAYTPVSFCTANQVLGQGIMLKSDNVTSVLAKMKERLIEFESIMASSFGKVLQMEQCLQAETGHDGHGDSPPDYDIGEKPLDIVNNPEAGIVTMLRNGMLALQLLPENSSAGIVVITDGCLSIPDSSVFDFLLTQLRNSTIACTFLKIGQDCSPCGQFGHICHTELMQFLATATFGAYFASCPLVSPDPTHALNVYHKALFLWSFQKGLEGFKYELIHQNLGEITLPAKQVEKLLSHPIRGKVASVLPTIRKKHTENKLNTSLFSILSTRLREGYTIKDVSVTKGETQVEVRLVLPWREYARFEYLASAPWPLETGRQGTHIEITLEGSYDFLHDMICTQMNTRVMSPFRTANVKKFWFALQGLSQTDQLLVHLQSFSANPLYYKVPESIQKGVPLFCLPQANSSVPVLNQQLRKDSALNHFASFWKPVVNLDIKVWQKWMHTHRIGVILEHDMPLSKYLHIPNASGRFGHVQCRQALMSLDNILRDWSTFVLLENQCYIKLLYKNPKNETPDYFVLLRITSKVPCLVLRLAFLGGTPGYERHQVMCNLKRKLADLKFPKRGTQKLTKTSPGSVVRKLDGKEMVRKPPLSRDWSEIHCCVLLSKPVENILIRYEKKPRDMTKLEDQSKGFLSLAMLSQSQMANKSAVSLFKSLSRYLYHQRWIWTIQMPSVQVSMQSVGRILSTFTKMRLQEGFHFGVTNSGIVNMALEVDMIDSAWTVSTGTLTRKPDTTSCVIQYVMFPPHSKTSQDSLLDDLDEMETTEADGELQIVTECWVEPQDGASINNSPERQHFDGASYQQISQMFFPRDLECVSTLVTFEHLLYLCQNGAIPADLGQLANNGVQPETILTNITESIHHVQFPFSILSLLKRSQQAELLFPIYMLDSKTNEEVQRDSKNTNNLLFSLFLNELDEMFQRSFTLDGEQSKVYISHLNAREKDHEGFTDVFPLEKLAASGTNNQSGKKSVKKFMNQCENTSEKKNSPEWKCFIRAFSSNCIFITILPASLDDLLLLKALGTSDDLREKESEEEDKVLMLNSHKAESVHSNTKDLKSVDAKSEEQAVFLEKGNDKQRVDEEDPIPEEQKHDIAEPVKPLLIPLYMYETTMVNIIESLVNPWIFTLPRDLHEDFSFDTPSDSSRPLASPRHKKVSFSTGDLADEEKGGTSNSRLRIAQERWSMDGIQEGIGDLSQHCSVLSEIYFSCYVKGVFRSLQKGYSLDAQDVDVAINNICEESLPLEMDITTFLYATCGHLQNLVSEARKEQNGEAKEEMFEKRSSVRFMDMEDGEVPVAPALFSIVFWKGLLGLPHCIQPLGVRVHHLLVLKIQLVHGEPDSQSGIPYALQLPRITLKLDLPSLNLDQSCEALDNLRNLTRNKFQEIVFKWFRPVTANPDYYFYCPEQPQMDELSDERYTTEVSEGLPDSMGEMEEPEVISHLTVKATRKREATSNASNIDSSESLVESVSDVEMYFDESKGDQNPLFLNFTCTFKSHLEHQSVSSQSLVTCLGEMKDTLENYSEIDFTHLKITFDLNILTLPTDLEVPTLKKPIFSRMFSNTSFNSAQDSDTEEKASNTDTAGVTRNDQSVLSSKVSSISSMKAARDVIGHLPPLQREAVTKCGEEIEWLLKDEIVSSLRMIQPISSEELQFVTNHIQQSAFAGKANCSHDTVQLQFVFGLDQSLPQFTEEFEKMNLPLYRLVREGDWYYVVKNRSHISFVNAVALSTALDELKWEGGILREKLDSPSSKSEPMETMDTVKPHKVMSPLALNQSKLAGAITSPLAQNQSKQMDSPVSQSRPVQKELQCTMLTEPGVDTKINDENLVPDAVDKKSTCSVSQVIHKKEAVSTGAGPPKAESFVTDTIATAEKRDEILPEPKDGKVVVKGKHLFGEAAADEEGIRQGGQNEEEDDNEGTSRTFQEKAFPFGMDSSERRSSDPAKLMTLSSDGGHGIVQKPNSLNLQHVETEQHSLEANMTDGQSEDYTGSEEFFQQKERELGEEDHFDSHDEGDKTDGILKRCSSFAGFKSVRTCEVVPSPKQEEILSQSPAKTAVPALTPIGRLRHFSAPSGQGTPRSNRNSTIPPTPSWQSSRGSFTEDAYDGDMSEIDDSGTSVSDNSAMFWKLPNFWLVMLVVPKAVDIFYQRRESGRGNSEEIIKQRELLSQVKGKIESICRKVNQILLLNDLYENRNCHMLLVPEADEEVTWNLDTHIKKHVNLSSSSEADDDEDPFERKYLAAAMDLGPGHFDCDCVFKNCFTLHPRLKTGQGRTGVSRGVQALRSVLNKFGVINRKNMFVIKESTGAVFYLRLKETCSSSRQLSTVSVDDMNDSSSGGWRCVDPGMDKDKDVDTISITSSTSALSSTQRGGYERVELNVHGIQDPGPEIKVDLMRLLQSKLDESVLDIITVMLRRNPVCKLTWDDVQFIQPLGSSPTEKLLLNLPSRVSHHLRALLYYIRQNLLQFLNVPNYVDTRPDRKFMVVIVLVISTGIACVSVSLVDGKEHTVRLLHCPKPSSQAHSSVHTQSDLEAFIYTEPYEAKGKKPGPTALIQFRIWERGSVDIAVLKDKLMGALKHALCDIVIEYYLLTAPICEVPLHLEELPSLPTHSAPSSPLVTKVEDFHERKFSLVSRKKSDAVHHKLERRQSLQNQSPLQSLKETFFFSKRVMSPPPDMHKTFDLTSFGTSSLQQIQPGQQSETLPRSHIQESTSQLLEQYQSGTFGNLHKVYTALMENWFNFCCQNGVPTVFQLELCLKSQFSVDFVLQELQNIVGNICSDINIKIFKVIPGKEMEELPVGIIYNPCRHPVTASNISEETSLDADFTVNFVPSKADTFIGIGRNFSQWQSSIESDTEDESGQLVTGVTQKVLSQQTSQKFYSSAPSTASDKTVIDGSESNFVPRQKLLMIFIKHKKIVVFTYNWASDFNSSLSKYLTRLVQWHNARAHLLNSIITQKMGLFNHYLFSDLANVPNPFINTSDVDHLIRSSTPSSKEHIRRTSSMTGKDRTPSLLFDTTFKDVFPWKTVRATLQVSEKDPVTQHGQQAQEIRRGIKKAGAEPLILEIFIAHDEYNLDPIFCHSHEEESLLKIQKLYLMWLKKTAGPNIQISEDDTVLLKQHSRLFHYCATPLLFFTQWRHKVLEKYRVTGQDSHLSPVSVSADSKSRSRHSSGTSVGSVRTKHMDGQDGKKKLLNKSSSVGKLTDSPESKTYEPAMEEDWHRTLLQEFRQQYIAYLQTIGFHYIHTTPVSYKHRSDRKGEHKFEEMGTHHRGIFNLQKTLSGGILLIELSFHAEYFCVKLYTYESSRLSDTVNQQMKLMFVDECEKCKDIIHVHSFAHDFHLRCVQAYLSGEQKVFPPNYHVVNFLTDFIKVYPYAPSFSRNFLQQDVVTVPKPSCLGQQLYEYMLNHAILYNMTSLKMHYPTDPETKDLEYSYVKMVEYALVSNFAQELLQYPESSKPEKENYSFGLIIFQDPHQLGQEMDRGSLVLKFFIVLTSCGELFPRHTLERTLGVLRSHKIHQSFDEEIIIEDKDLKDPAPISHLLGVARDPPNYLGFSNTYQPPMYQMLQRESEGVRQKIEQMAEESMEKCRRDVLWQRMLVGDRAEEELKRKRRSDTEDSKDSLMRLSYEELCELLGRAYKCPLCEIDSRLISFQHMSLTWYAGLAQVLFNKYQDDLRRYFSSPDGQVQYHIILNPNNLDMFMMLCVDHFNCKAEKDYFPLYILMNIINRYATTEFRYGQKKTGQDLSAVFKKQAKEQESRDSKQTEEESVQTHIESFVNACCFHLWTSIL